jgi:hypothetical protein
MMAELHPLFELIAIASLCGWAACLALGFSLFSPAKSMLVGAIGIIVGWSAWQLVGLPFGPRFSGFPLLPSFVGTLLSAIVVETVRHLVDGSPTGKHTPRAVRQRPGQPRVLKDSLAPASESPASSAPDEAHDSPAAQQSGA